MKNKEENKKYCWSINEERYFGEFDTKEEAFREAIVDRNLSIGDKVYVGVIKRHSHADFVDADSIIDDMNCRAVDEGGEFAEDYLNELNEEDKRVLESLIVKFLEEKASIDFFLVEDVEELKV